MDTKSMIIFKLRGEFNLQSDAAGRGPDSSYQSFQLSF